MPDELEGGLSLEEAKSKGDQKPAQTDAKPAEESSASATDITQPNGAAKPVVEPRPPFHQDAAVQEYLEKQWEKRQTKLQRDWDKKWNEQREMYTRQLEAYNSRQTQPGQSNRPQLTADQRQAREELAEILLGDPEIRERYGLSKVEQLEKAQRDMTIERSREIFDSELEPLVQKAAEKYGIDPKELDDEIRDFVQNDPWFADKSFTRGSASKVMRLFFADKESELAEREANLKLIKAQKEQKKVATESPARQDKGSSVPKERDLKSFLDRRVDEEGITFH